MSRLSRWRTPIAFAVLMLVVVWVGQNGYRQDLAILMVTYGMISLGLYSHYIMGNSMSVAYNAYVAIGGYALGILCVRTNLSLFLALPIGIVISAAVAVLLGLTTYKLSGFYLAAVTLLFGEAFTAWLVDSTDLTGGPAGVVLTRGLTVFGHEVTRQQLVVAALLTLFLAAWGLDRLRTSPFGIALRAKGEAARAVESSGVSTRALTLISLGIGAALGSVGGWYFAAVNLSMLPESVPLSVAFVALFIPFLGGYQSPWGSVAGAVIVTQLTFNLTWFQDTGTLAFAVAVLLVLIFARRGLLGLLDDVLAGLTRLGRKEGRDHVQPGA
ncbi:branched-chain amino acid ABC transporter permease [Streptosporangium sp. NBC_01755]|uniref:branched-chain amino acid ABC transporter permease n=1 Tax=unclassified Streptosporangium TaxID=2632669 RepID=UPI002DD8ED96|nr:MULTISPECIES: branched-chain amino acid ABC transporter permease [unclassified Streptosporangium]WSA26762.1 branched-chain amino acid ABC transporter permease [Streptosporangium sp. NBC_01810]WSD01813.1 branched-chain amino acid ABC transporter permease [Streptosporangium sp. NBC_01755]